MNIDYYTGIGSRETPDDVLALMTRLAKELAENGKVLRSGGADGADAAFEAGAGELKEIFLPWPTFNSRASPYPRPTPEAYRLSAKFHPAWERLSMGAKALHARNAHQVLGHDLRTPSLIVYCWTPNAAGGGGTGQAIRIARAHEIPVCDLADPEQRRVTEEYLKRRSPSNRMPGINV